MAKLSKDKDLSKSESETRNLVEKARTEFNLVHEKIKAELDIIDTTDADKRKESFMNLLTESLIRDLYTAFTDLKKGMQQTSRNDSS